MWRQEISQVIFALMGMYTLCYTWMMTDEQIEYAERLKREFPYGERAIKLVHRLYASMNADQMFMFNELLSCINKKNMATHDKMQKLSAQSA